MFGHQFGTIPSLICGLMLSLLPGLAGAQVNSVVVESKTVRVGDDGIRIGVYISNAEPIVALIMPLEFRSIDPGAYIQTGISRGMNSSGRLYNSPLGLASAIQNRYPTPGGTPCSGPISNTYQAGGANVDLISPDGFFLETHSIGDETLGDDIDLDPRTETPGVDPPSYQFTFDVSNVPGRFEIDTCCVRPNNHLAYIGRSSPDPIVPSFTKGVVTIHPCDCPCWADPNCDGVRGDPVDATIVRNVANGTAVEIFDPGCPTSRTDVNIDGVTNSADVGLFESVAFGGLVDTTVFCRPCGGCPPPIDPTNPPDTSGNLDPLDPWDPIPPDLDTTNWVTVRSRRVLPGADDVVIDVWIENITPAVAIVLPFEFRTVSGGAFVSQYEDFGIPPLSRLGQSPLGLAGVNWPAATVILGSYQAPHEDSLCSGPVSHTFGDRTLAAPGSPDGILIVSVSNSGEGEPNELEPGSDPRSYGGGSIRFIVDIGPASGVFEIDTCCVKPANHLAFVTGYFEMRVPGFTKGVITVGCFCQCHGDPQCDGLTDILDVVRTINTAFRGVPEPVDQDCTHSRTDVDASGVTDVLDVTKMIDVVLNDGQPEVNFTDPCAGL